MNAAARRKRVVIVGLRPRIQLERPTSPGEGVDRLLSAFLQPASESPWRPAENPAVAGLPIVERSFVEALVKYGSYDDYVVLARDSQRAAARADLGIDEERGSRITVRSANEIAGTRDADVIVHSAAADALAVVAARDRLFTPFTPVHMFLSGLSDPYTLVPNALMLAIASAPFDCLTSLNPSNRTVATRIFGYFADYFDARWKVRPCFAGRFTDGTQGVDVADFRRDGEMRAHVRRILNLGADTTVFLYFGRLGPRYKADLLPLVLMFHREFAASNLDAVLVLAGADEGAAGPLATLVRGLGGESRIKVIPNVCRTLKRMLYSLADVFVSPSDNIQEAWGMTVVEAMASGLPVIVSDWDGYRHTVEDGVEGWRIPTRANPEVGQAVGAFGVANVMDQHLLYAQNVGVDTMALREAMRRLASDRALRERMGESARRAAARWDWSAIVPTIERSWDESLAAAREYRASASDPPALSLYGLDMARLHRHYPTADYADTDSLVWGDAFAPHEQDEVSRLMNAIELPSWDPQVWPHVCELVGDGQARPLGTIVEELATRRALDEQVARFYLLRLVKYGVLQVRPA
jgi:glycosyltransferase involved in cell wall biosynthesis